MSKHNVTNKEVFTVPEGYFELLNKNILDATVKGRAVTTHRKKHILGRFSRAFGYAAVVAFLLVVAGNFLFTSNKTNSNKSVADNTNTESEYIDNIFNSYTIDDYTFYCYLTESEYE